ncbi:flavodoxin [Pseudomonas saudimassiliensis]|uniref:Flavodoxin n=1 Tax=Pseudomonas saudimassiliensis TaxID=1461581 RepID=A0A078M7Q3_9PSED|nr:flavodoxin domain-containing protein [Pseudomonas saudimassiliensis]CEA00666.1 flavodoxin [Pseudomonas saudimassiliensis]CEF25227.1 flavodoxin [Pseudomonas saudimassiliensis]
MRLAILSGSVFGTADFLADEAAERCAAAGLQVSRIKPASVDALLAADAQAILVCCSTTGMGELPDAIMPFYSELQTRFPLLTGIPFGVIGLGDSSYGDTFCQGGEQLRELLLELQAREALPMLRLDASETVTPEVDAEPWLDEFIGLLQNG